MFLTRMALDVNRPEAAELIKDPLRVHRAVSTAFELNPQFLWRLDELSHRTWLVMRSRIRPSLEELHLQYGYPGMFPSWETLNLDWENDNAYPGTVWNFDLCASPTGMSSAVREDWLAEEWLRDWLRRQGEACGFEVVRANLDYRAWLAIGEKHLLTTRWTGVLRVTDETRFTAALATGIGGARDLGAGMMTIASTGTVWGV